MPSPTRAGAAASAAGLLLLAAACGTDRPASDSTPTVTATVTETASPAPAPSPTPTPTLTATPTPTPATAPSGAAGLAGLLLPAAQMAGFNAQWSWSEQATTTTSSPAGLCARLPLDALGADAVVRRTYVPTGDDGEATAVHEVASFVDPTSLDQALSVMRTWHDTCRKRLRPSNVRADVTPVRTVSTPKGQASWYLTKTVADADANEGHFDALGLLVDGLTVEVVDLDLVGQDYNYAAGSEPMVTALRNAAALLP